MNCRHVRRPAHSTPEYAEIVVRVDEEFEIRSHFLKAKMIQITILSQPVQIRGAVAFERHGGIHPRLAASHAHDFEQRLPVEFVIQLVLINEQEVRHEREIEFIVAKLQLR